jgi:hypothetical protein
MGDSDFLIDRFSDIPHPSVLRLSESIWFPSPGI